MAESAERAKFGPQPHGHEVMHNNGEATVNGRLLREIGDVLAPDTIEVDLALHRPQFTDDSLQQRRLAGAVWSDDRQQATPGNFSLQVVNRRVDPTFSFMTVDSGGGCSRA